MVPSYHVPSVDKAIRILYFLKQPLHQQSTLSEICHALDLNKSTAYAILKTLQARGLVVYYEQSKRYSLGLSLIELASAVSSQLTHVSLIKPALRRFVHDLGLSCSLAQRKTPDTLIIVEMIESETEVRVTLPVGRELALLTGAAGKCFLAYLPEKEAEAVLHRVGLAAYTPQSITDIEVYKKALLQVRQNGFATSMGEYIAGVNGVASPIFGPDGQVSLVVTAVGLSPALLPEKLCQVGQHVREFALEMTRLLGGPPDPFLTNTEPGH